METRLTFFSKFLIGTLIVIAGISLEYYLIKYQGMGFNLPASFIFGIAFAALVVGIKDVSIFIWAIVSHTIIKRRDRKKIEKVISELRYGKQLAITKREELAKSIEDKLSKNPTEEQQKYYIDLYLKMDEVFEKAEHVYNSQIYVHKMEIEHFYS